MIAMPLKVDIQMASCGQTWSEAHYYLAASSVPTDTSPMIDLCSFRAGCLGANASVTGAEISDVPGNRLVESLFFPNGGKVSKFLADEVEDLQNSATPNNSLLINMTSSPALQGPNKKLYLSAPPQGMITTLGGNTNQLGNYPNFVAPLGQYMQFLTGNNKPQNGGGTVQNLWGYRSRSPANALQSTGSPFEGPGPTLYIGIGTPGPLAGVGFGPGLIQEVYLTGWRRKNPRLPGLAGAWKVASILPPVAPATQPWIYYLLGSTNVDPTNFSSVGKIAPLTYQYPAYGIYWQLERAVTRKRGESIARRRGRSPIRA
jgi:hypothetical protein